MFYDAGILVNRLHPEVHISLQNSCVVVQVVRLQIPVAAYRKWCGSRILVV